MRKNIINFIVAFLLIGLICLAVATIFTIYSNTLIGVIFFSISGGCLLAIIGLILYAYIVINKGKKKDSKEEDTKYIETVKEDKK